MQERTVDDLIEELRQVRIKSDQVRREEDRLWTEEQRIIQDIEAASAIELGRVVRPQRTRTAVQAERVGAAPQPVQPIQPIEDVQTVALRQGDRVQIINKVSVPKWREEELADRLATVTHSVGDYIYITTDNKFETYRLRKNLIRIQDDQQNHGQRGGQGN